MNSALNSDVPIPDHRHGPGQAEHHHDLGNHLFHQNNHLHRHYAAVGEEGGEGNVSDHPGWLQLEADAAGLAALLVYKCSNGTSCLNYSKKTCRTHYRRGYFADGIVCDGGEA